MGGANAPPFFLRQWIMKNVTNELDKTTFLPDQLNVLIKKRLIEVFSVIIFFISTAFVTSILSYHPNDASLNTSSSEPIQNIMGSPGSIVSDLAIQNLGFAALLIFITTACCGILLFRKIKIDLFWIRFVTLIFSILIAASALAGLGTMSFMDTVNGSGGIIGNILLNSLLEINNMMGLAAYEEKIYIALFALFFPIYLFSLGFSFEQWKIFILSCKNTFTWLVKSLYLLIRKTLHYSKHLIFAIFGLEEKKGHDRERNEPFFQSNPNQGGVIQDREINHLLTPGKRAIASKQRAFVLDSKEYQFPPFDLLKSTEKSSRNSQLDLQAVENNKKLLSDALNQFEITGQMGVAHPGPIVTLYEFQPDPGIRLSRIIALSDDVARSMSKSTARITPMTGSQFVGIELPNENKEVVQLRELLESKFFETTQARLPLVLGKDISGKPVIADLGSMPHLLIAGTTGSGKSVAINTMILSLIYKYHPSELKFLMIDPKWVELSVYDGIPNLAAPVVTDTKKAVYALQKIVQEMEKRYRDMSIVGAKNIHTYNEKVAEAAKNGKELFKTVQIGFDSETGKPNEKDEYLEDLSPKPMIVVVVDEMADLMTVAKREVETAVQRLSQMARAAGIHLIMATQRPSVDVITGTIKANFPSRISFQVSSKIDSRTIIGEQGAEQLLGQGDMLCQRTGGKITRIHGPLVSQDEVESVVSHLKQYGGGEYLYDDFDEALEKDSTEEQQSDGDDLYNQAVNIVRENNKATTSFIQRKLRIGYNRAADLIEKMEADGVIGPADHVGKRNVLI